MRTTSDCTRSEVKHNEKQERKGSLGYGGQNLRMSSELAVSDSRQMKRRDSWDVKVPSTRNDRDAGNVKAL